MMKRAILIILSVLVLTTCSIPEQEILIEAESLTNKGGWVVDPQFVEQMGSPYLLAHGLGSPLNKASDTITLPAKGRYHTWVRTKNWAPGNWDAPGRFRIAFNGKELDQTPGVGTGDWAWEYAGRCFSSSHAGLGGPRVMHTTGQMGVAVGYAASLCKKYQTDPRGIYKNHINELKDMIENSGKAF